VTGSGTILMGFGLILAFVGHRLALQQRIPKRFVAEDPPEPPKDRRKFLRAAQGARWIREDAGFVDVGVGGGPTDLTLDSKPAEQRLGHPAFDEHFSVAGPPGRRSAAMTSEVRERLLALWLREPVFGEPKLSAVHLAGGDLWVRVDGRPEPDRWEALFQALEGVVREMRFERYPDRLAQVATRDPNPGVRRSALWELADRAVVMGLRQDPNPQVRVHAFAKIRDWEALDKVSQEDLAALAMEQPERVCGFFSEPIPESLALRLASEGIEASVVAAAQRWVAQRGVVFVK